MDKKTNHHSFRSLFLNTILIGSSLVIAVSCSSDEKKAKQSSTETKPNVEETSKKQPEVNENGFMTAHSAFELLKNYPVFIKDAKVNGKKKYFLTEHSPSEAEPYFIFKIAYLEENGYVPIVFYKMDAKSKKVYRKNPDAEWESI